jgi:predicted Ser/Thr protein kinase
MIDRLGKYRITEVLGEGAMGIVYRAFDPDIRRQVALKTMRALSDGDGVSGVSPAERFRNEARAAGRLQHPGIVAVYDFGRDAGVDFIAMEYVRGHTLSRYLAQAAAGQLDIDDNDVQSIIGQLLDALHHAHEQGVWHRDVKPSNLIITNDGKVKVSDFGIARIESAELTLAASAIGTPLYMAPEQFQGRAIDRRVDLYATGVVLYQMLTKRTPFTGAPETLMYKAVHEPPVLPSRLPGLAHLQPYDEVLARALAKQPEQRYADAVQFRDALVAVAGRMHAAAVSSATITALLPPRPAAAAAAAADRGTGSSVPTHFDAAALAQAEASLARHVGPLSQVLVRRAARECHDLPALYARLAEQVTDPAARSAFVNQAALALAGTGSGSLARSAVRSAVHPAAHSQVGSPASGTGPAPAGHSHATAAPSAAMVDAAQRLLARHVGPIAAVLVKKALAAAPQREAFIQRLVVAVDDPAARLRLTDELKRLPP